MFKETFDGNLIYGPSILIVAGVHGNEITPLRTLMLFLKNKVASTLTPYYKKLTVLNGVNTSALSTGTREMKSGSKDDLNRLFEIDQPDPVKVIKDLVDTHDLIIDIHSSPNIPDFVLIDIDENADSYVEWCNKSMILYAARYSSANTIKRYAINKGKQALTIELNGMDKPDDGSAFNGISMLTKLIQNYSKVEFEKNPCTIKPMVELRSYIGGLFTFTKDLGSYVNEGEDIGVIQGLNGDVLTHIKTNTTGVIIEGPDTSYYVKGGSKVALIQPR